MRAFLFFVIFLITLLSSCSGNRMIQTDLYFGQSRPDGTLITDAEWQSFKTHQISKVFKEGSTTISATGNWYDPGSHQPITEPTYVVVYHYKKSPKKSAQIDSLITVYKVMFKQQSVLRVDKKVKAKF
ncbi:MAG TPA: DUF3574 domain-containing protein [Cyclobacteriaceae bacterium]|nr:DUF3574 domain-containing protein [Cyclobacteriaceae bacterium]HMV10787.1 DUF3574 domain-containing protein [Cyclobacteriaceae bacterium]HMV88746.1 DUF3574 domain-containing protein [Cyclobacteriaceae bacterium]HMX02360.1 DUF3574 domain-containing protein [Cyclobacteriaceae bacterium]HMX51731.1 DUF3574 domain-containing protein [Cyclobacteriaceae bacterium]